MEPELGIFHVIVFPRGQEDYVHVPSGQETGPDGLSADAVMHRAFEDSPGGALEGVPAGDSIVLLRSSMLTVVTVKSEVV